jgi:hypothetical protein
MAPLSPTVVGYQRTDSKSLLAEPEGILGLIHKAF